MKYNTDLTYERASELLYIDQNDTLRWKVNKGGRAKTGCIAGYDNGNNLRRVRIDNSQYLVHRIIWLLTYHHWPIEEIDHKNRDSTNDSIFNLRESTHSENQWNKDCHRNNKLGIKGVNYHKHDKRYIAQIRLAKDLPPFYIGSFKTAQEASWAYEFIAKALHGKYYYKYSEKT